MIRRGFDVGPLASAHRRLYAIMALMVSQSMEGGDRSDGWMDGWMDRRMEGKMGDVYASTELNYGPERCHRN